MRSLKPKSPSSDAASATPAGCRRSPTRTGDTASTSPSPATSPPTGPTSSTGARSSQGSTASPKFKTSLTAWNGETIGIHFIHRRSPRPDARPLLIQHGWPSTVFDFHKIIDQLAEPTDPDAPAFHVIAPSLPGYGWSDIPTRMGLGPSAIADIWVDLMARLGYDRFLYHGGDWGAAIGGQLVLRHPDRIPRIHLTMAALPPGGSAAQPQSEQERRFVTEEQEPYVRDDAAHRGIHGTKFQTMAFHLEDSPVGLLAWLVDKWWILADIMREDEKPRGGDLYRRFTKR